MATTSFLRTAGLVLALGLAPCLARAAAAQNAIRVGAVVTAPAGLFVVRPDSVVAHGSTDVRRVRIAGARSLDIQTGPGAVVRVDERPLAGMRVTIDYVGS